VIPNKYSQILRHPTRLPHHRPRPDLRPSLPLPWPHRKSIWKTLLPPRTENLRDHFYLLGSDLSNPASLRRWTGSYRQNTAQSRHRRARPSGRSSVPSPLAVRLHGFGNSSLDSRSQGLIQNELPLRCFARVSWFPVLYLGFVPIIRFMIHSCHSTNTLHSYRRRHRDYPDQVHLPCC
jgi:hypothetical protein